MLKELFISTVAFALKLQFTIMISAPFVYAGLCVWKLL